MLPAGVQIRNDAGSTASYLVEMALGVRGVRLSLGDGAERTVRVAPGETRHVQLGPAGR